MIVNWINFKTTVTDLLLNIKIYTIWNISSLQLLKPIIIFNSSLLKVQETTYFFKKLLRFHESRILNTAALVHPDGGDLAAPISDFPETSVHLAVSHSGLLTQSCHTGIALE